MALYVLRRNGAMQPQVQRARIQPGNALWMKYTNWRMNQANVEQLGSAHIPWSLLLRAVLPCGGLFTGSQALKQRAFVFQTCWA